MSQGPKKQKQPRLSTSICATVLAFSMLAYVPADYANDNADREGDRAKTAMWPSQISDSIFKQLTRHASAFPRRDAPGL